jgi:hypothetical protein
MIDRSKVCRPAIRRSRNEPDNFNKNEVLLEAKRKNLNF